MGIRDCVYFLDEEIQKIVYPIGKYIAVKSLEKMSDQYEMNFIKLNELVTHVIAMAISPDKCKIAVSQKIKGEIYPQITIHNIKTGATRGESKSTSFQYTETKSESFVSLGFSHEKQDSRYIACVTDEHDCQIVFYDLMRNKLVGTTSMANPVSKIAVNPKDSHTVSISGPEIFKIFRVHESSLRNPTDVLKLNQKQNFTDHCWIDDERVVVGTDQGSLFVIKKIEQKWEVKQHISRAFADIGIGVSHFCFLKNRSPLSRLFPKGLLLDQNLETSLCG